MSGVGPMLLGGALVALGVIASALADRIRGLKVAREASPVRRERAAKSDAVEAIDQAIVKEVESKRITIGRATDQRQRSHHSARECGLQEVRCGRSCLGLWRR